MPGRPPPRDAQNAIEYNSVVAAIKLTGNSKVLFNQRLDSQQVTAIARALEGDEHVHTLDLSYNRIDDEGVKALAELVRKNGNIASIILSNNRVGDEGVGALVDALEATGGAGLQQLVLSCNLHVTDDSIMRLADHLRGNEVLSMLDLGHTGMGLKGMMALFAALHERPGAATLEALRLDAPTFRGPSEHQTRHLGNAIAASRNLKELSLGTWQLSDGELRHLVRNAFVNVPGLMLLSLRSNKLSDMAGPVLAEMVGVLEGLEELDLSGNSLGDRAAVELCQALIDLGPRCVLWSLDLSTNCVNDLGLEAIAETIARCPSLQVVRVWGNRFGRAASETMAEVLDQLAEDGRELDIDVRPYCVDGAWMVARE